MLYEKPRKNGDSDAGKKKTQSVKGSPFVNLRCGAVLENGPDAGNRCGEGFFRCTYTNVANGYTDERSLAACRKELEAEGVSVSDYLEKYTYAYPIWRCNLDGTITLVDAPYRVYDNSIQYRRYMKKRAKDRLEAETA